MRWFPARTARTTVMIDVDRVGILYTFKRGSLKIFFQSTLCISCDVDLLNRHWYHNVYV